MFKLIPNDRLNKLMIKPINYSYNTSKTQNENNKNQIHHLKKFLNFSKNHNNHKIPSQLKLDNRQETDF